MTYHPGKPYLNVIKLAQRMGANLLGGGLILVQGDGNYGERAITGITGEAVSIITRDINAAYGNGKYKTHGTFVYFSKKEWDDRVENASGWLFTPGAPHTIIKHAKALFMRVENSDGMHFFHWDNQGAPPIIKGRIGLRQMFTRSARYKNFRVSTPK